jgi:hypothetical protein
MLQVDFSGIVWVFAFKDRLSGLLQTTKAAKLD